MIKFTKKILLLILVIGSITIAVNSVYMKQHEAITDKFAFIPEKIQICNFGSSHGMRGFNYEYIDGEYACFNFGLNMQSLSYDYILFQCYSNHIDDGTVVFIPISYFSLFGKEETSLYRFASKNKRYYSILPPSLIKDYDRKTDIYISFFPALVADIEDLIKTVMGISTSTLDEYGHNVITDVSSDIDLNANVKISFEDGFSDRLDDEGNGIINQEEIDALYSLIEGCQEKGAIPVLLTTPYLHEYTDEIKENAKGLYDQFYSIINQIVADTGAEFYDYAFDERFVDDYSLFYNSDHLNEYGSLNFVNILMDEIVYAKGYY